MSRGKSKSDITSFLGPVESLESYVKADWWRELFNANYLRTDGDLVADNDITRNEIDICTSILNPEKTDVILDLCCGQGRHSLELARRGFVQIYGLDRSHYLITRARKNNRAEGFSIHLREGDARLLPYAADTFDYIIILGNSFGYFESHIDDEKVLQEAFRVLKPGGKLLLDIPDGAFLRNNYVPRSWEWIDQNFFVCRERCLSENKERLITREVITHVKNGVMADQFYAERLYSPENLEKILTKCVFSSITFHEPIIAESQRNQDPGMMKRRLVVTASVQKKWSKLSRPKKTKNVTVLLGDPQLADRIKPACIFDEDDYYTINQLKEALATIPGYSFAYIDNHAGLARYLQYKKTKIDFVFNLCDEGYKNEPLMELHIPALLEMLAIPYTGGTPQCLAYCYDKSLVRGIAKELDIPVPQAFMINPGDSLFIEFPIRFPVIVKPNFGDSSFGITQESVCYDITRLENAINRVRTMTGSDTSILIEEFLPGKDISVGIIGNFPNSCFILPMIEEDYSLLPPTLPKICGYEAKWDPDSAYAQIESVPALLSEDVQRFLGACCQKLFGRLGCRDYARFDWRLDQNGTPRLLEVNPNPGWCWDGHLAKMAAIANISYSGMLVQILKSADKRISQHILSGTISVPPLTSEELKKHT